jgi:hypothetical protein
MRPFENGRDHLEDQNITKSNTIGKVYTAEDTKYPVKFFTPPLMGLIRHGE